MASAGASLIPSPIIATTRPSCWRRRTHSALSAGVSSASTCLTWTFFATARAGAGRSPVRIVRSLQAEVLQVVDDVVRLAAGPGRGPRSRRRPGRRRPRAGRSGPTSSSAFERLLDLGRDLDPALAEEPEVADEDLPRPSPRRGRGPRPRRRAGPGSRRRRAGRARGARPRRRAGGPAGARSAARRRRRGGAGRPAVPGPKRDAVAELGPALGQGAGLVEGERVDPRQPLERRPPLDQHPAAGEPGRRRQDGRGGGQDQGARAGDDQHGQRRHQVDRRGARPSAPSARGPGRSSPRKTSAAAVRTAGRNSRA